jgi:glycosyltransferase involved in cell wall biosynthesis
MRCLFATVAYSPFRAGAAAYVQGVAERLVEDGHQATVYTTDMGEIEHLWSKGKRHLPAGEEVLEGVHVARFPVRHLPFSPLSYRAIQRAALEVSRLPLPTGRLVWRLFEYTPWVPCQKGRLDSSGERADVVHALGLLFASMVKAAHGYARRMGIPFVLTPQIHLGPLQGFHTMPHQMQLLRQSDAIVAQTMEERDFLTAHGIAGDKIEVIGPPGVDLGLMPQSDPSRIREEHGLKRPFALFLGTVSFDKGAVHLLEAMRRLWKEGYDLDLVLAGPTMDHFLQHHALLSARERSRCHLLGTIREDEKWGLLGASEMLVLPSRSESFGIVYLEAWAARKPVVGASVGCVSEVIRDGQDGYLVPFGDAPAIAEAVLALWRDEKERKRLGEAGYAKVVQKYASPVVYHQIKELYSSLTGGLENG